MQQNTPVDHARMSLETPPAFFVAGGTLSRDAACYVVRKADEELLNGLRQGQFCYVLTSRQMGKSSLMVRAATQLRQEGVAVAVLDLTAIGQNLTPEQWYDGLLNRIGRQLNLEDELDDFWTDNERVGPLQRFLRALLEVILKQTPGRIVLFIDEIDAVRSLPFSTDEFFAGIRECYNGRGEEPDLRRLTFALFGVASPSDLIRDGRVTPFNIGQRIELRDFTPEEAAPLAQGLGERQGDKPTSRQGEGGEAQGIIIDDKASAIVNAHLIPDASNPKHPIPDTQHLLTRILYWTNGHPYLTQRLCQALAEQAASASRAGPGQSALSAQQVDALCEEMFLSPRARERDDNLLFVRERLLRSDVDIAGLLDLYAHIRAGQRIADEETSRFVDVLRLSGIVRAEHGRLRVRNRIYAHVFDRAWALANMPDAEMRRQRIAYRKGLLRALALSSVVLLLMTVLTAYAVKNANTAHAREMDAQKAEARASSASVEARKAAVSERAAKEQAQTAAIEAGKASVEAQRSADRERAAKNEAVFARNKQQVLAQKYAMALKDKEAYARGQEQAAGQARLQKRIAMRFGMAAKHNETQERLQKERVERLLYPDSISHAQKALSQLNVAEAQGFLERYAHPADPEHDLRGFEWRYLKRQSIGDSQRTLQGHQDSVYNIAVSPDGLMLASSGNDRAVQLRNLQTGERLPAPQVFHGSIPVLAFSPDKRTLAVTTTEKTLLWDVRTASIRETLTPEGKPLTMSALAFSPDGKWLAMGSYSGSIDLWDTATRQTTRHLLHHPNGDGYNNNYQIDALAFSPDGKWLASCLWDHNGLQNSTKLWDVATGREMATLGGTEAGHRHWSRVYSLAFSRDSAYLATGGQDHIARIWNTQKISTPTISQELASHANEVTGVAYSLDGKWLATGSSDGGIKLWDVGDKATRGKPREVTTLRGHTKAVTSVAFTPDSRSLVSGSLDKTLKVWELAPALPHILAAHQSPIDTLVYSRDGKWLATGCTYQGDVIRIWNAKTLQLQATTEAHPGGACAAFAPDGKTIVVAGYDQTLTLCDVTTGKPVAEFKGFMERFNAVVFSPDGKTVATGGQNGTFASKGSSHAWNGFHPRLWDVATRSEISEFARHQGHYGWVLCLAFSPDSKTLVSGGGGGELRWWDVAARKELGSPPRQNNGVTVTADFAHQKDLFALAFSPDGKWLATGSEDNTARLWNVRARKPAYTLLGHGDIVYAAVFSPDGKTLATGSRDGLVKLWSLATLRDNQVLETLTLASHQEGIRSLQFSPDSNTLTAGYLGGNVRFWQADALAPTQTAPDKRRQSASRQAQR